MIARALLLSASLHLGLGLVPAGAGSGSIPPAPDPAGARPGTGLVVRFAIAPRTIPESAPAPPRPEAGKPAAGGKPAPAPATGLMPLPTTVFLPAQELNRRPVLVSMPSLDEEAGRHPTLAGTAGFRIFIDAGGAVVAVAVERSSLPDAVTAAAKQALARARFLPGYLHGDPVGSQMLWEMTLSPALENEAEKIVLQSPAR